MSTTGTTTLAALTTTSGWIEWEFAINDIDICLTLCLIVCMVLCLLRIGCCGPRTLKSSDIDAFATFKSLYHSHENMQEYEEFFEVVRKKAYCVRVYQLPLSPADRWSDPHHTLRVSFLVQVSKHINLALLDFQHRVWKRHGNFAVNLPVFIVAEEWRSWAMTNLQQVADPEEAPRLELKSRLKWLQAARSVGLQKVATLNTATCWNESDELGLLVTLREEVQPYLVFYFERWHLFQLQQHFSSTASQKFIMLFVQLIRSTTCFLQKCICTTSLRIGDYTTTAPEDANALDKALLKVSQKCQFWDLNFPACYRDEYFAHSDIDWTQPGTGKGISDFKEVNSDMDSLTPAERQIAESIVSELFSGKLIRPAVYGNYGLEANDLMIIINHCATLINCIEVLVDCSMVVQSLHNFSALGGSLFISKFLDVEHFHEVMVFLESTANKTHDHIEVVADYIQRGWSKVRRGTAESSWSNTHPVDNVRQALRLWKDVNNCTTEIFSLAKTFQESVAAVRKPNPVKGGLEDLTNSTQKDVALYRKYWDILAAKNGAAAESGQPTGKSKTPSPYQKSEPPPHREAGEISIEAKLPPVR